MVHAQRSEYLILYKLHVALACNRQDQLLDHRKAVIAIDIHIAGGVLKMLCLEGIQHLGGITERQGGGGYGVSIVGARKPR